MGCGVKEVFSAIFNIAVLRMGAGLRVVAIIISSAPLLLIGVF